RKARRRLDETGQDCGFAEGDIACGLAEIALARGLNAVRTSAEIDTVQVEFENVVLRIVPFEPEREQCLLNLALERAFGRQEQVLRKLLRDGRTALDDLAGACIAPQRARKADRVDAEMRAEALVLDGDEG